jgi:hypothetical protein
MNPRHEIGIYVTIGNYLTIKSSATTYVVNDKEVTHISTSDSYVRLREGGRPQRCGAHLSCLSFLELAGIRNNATNGERDSLRYIHL